MVTARKFRAIPGAMAIAAGDPDTPSGSSTDLG